jgi:integrase
LPDRNGWRNAMAQQSRHIPLSPEALEAIERQLEAFRRKFGRDPNDNDPILFDPDADDPVPLSDEKYERTMIEAMAEVGISQAMIFAFKRTGRIVTERNKNLLTPEELREWNDAVDEYHGRIESGEVV